MTLSLWLSITAQSQYIVISYDVEFMAFDLDESCPIYMPHDIKDWTAIAPLCDRHLVEQQILFSQRKQCFQLIFSTYCQFHCLFW